MKEGEPKPKIGDIVEITWKDHFEYRGKLPNAKMEVKTWGKLSHDLPEGYAVTMSEVQTDMTEQQIEKDMTSQWIWRNMVVDIVVLKKNES